MKGPLEMNPSSLPVRQIGVHPIERAVQGSAIGNKAGDEDVVLRGILMEETTKRAKGHRDFRTFAVNIAHHLGYDK